MPINLYDKIKPKGEFAVADAADIEMTDGKRLEEAFEELKTEAGGGGVSAVDLSGYESGTVVETYSDGSTVTYTFEFDSDGNPIKITDSDGNETVLTW